MPYTGSLDNYSLQQKLFKQPYLATRFQAGFSKLSFMPEMQLCILNNYRIDRDYFTKNLYLVFY